MATLRPAAALRREVLAEVRIPYSAHVAPLIVRTLYGDYVQTFRLGGASFESNDDDELNNWHERLNVLWRNIAGPEVALWTHVIRHRAAIAADSPEYEIQPQTDSTYADRLHRKYHRRLSNETLMINEVYLSMVHRPASGGAAGLVSKALASVQRADSKLVLCDALDACEKLRQILLAGLERYEPEPSAYIRSGTSGAHPFSSSLRCWLTASGSEYRFQRVPSIRRSPPRVCCLEPRPSNTALPPRRASAACWESRSIRLQALSECTTAFYLRRLRSLRRNLFHF